MRAKVQNNPKSVLAYFGVPENTNLRFPKREFENKKRRNPLRLRRFLAPCRGFEPPACRLGVPAHVSYRITRDALKCPQTRMNQRFLKEQHVTECWVVLC